jgi:[acyl-carrier-protein] S-malonyltransferase
MKAAMIFPGQGSQYVGMGKDLVENFPRAREIYREADEVLSYPISRLCFQGDPGVLKETKNAQPAILLHSTAAAAILREEAAIEPAIVAGHSLGEYSALAAAGVLDPMDALRIVRKRGELMFEAGLRQPGTMAAVMGLDCPAIEEVCSDVSSSGKTVVVANVNSPGQIVISGHVEAVEEAMELLTERGAKKVVRLNVSGAFHSPLVAPAQKELVDYINEFPFEDTAVKVISNVDARIMHRKEEMINALSRQLTSPVLWADSMNLLLEQWEGDLLEVGPGRVLAGLLRRIDRERQVQTAGTSEELEKLVAPEVEMA